MKTWMELEGSMLSQLKKDKYHYYLITCGIKKPK